MLDDWPILSLIIFSPLLGVLALLFVPKGNGKWIKIVAILATLLPLLLTAWLYAGYDHQKGGSQFVEDAAWLNIPLSQEGQSIQGFAKYNYSFHYKVGVDGLSLPLLFLTAFVSFMAALAASTIRKRWKTFYILFLLLEVGMFGVFLAKDLVLFFLFFEVTLVPMFFLIGIWGLKDREKAANKFLLYNGIGSAAMLIAFLILINTAGLGVINPPGMDAPDQEHPPALTYSGDLDTIASNLSNPDAVVNIAPKDFAGTPFHMDKGLKWTVFILLLVAFGIKLPIFPFHTWMVRVHGEAPPPVVMIHSGILLKMGAYGLLRFGLFLFPGEAHDFAWTLAILGAVNVLYGAAIAFVQKDLRLVLAYSSVSHMGIVLIGLAAMNDIGLQGAVFQLVSHGLISALLFLVLGSIYERTQTTDLHQLGGMAKQLPFISGVLLFAGLASLGLPGLSGFVGELMAFLGLFDAKPWVAAVAAIGIVLAAAYVLRAVMRIVFGPMKDAFGSLKDARWVEAFPMIALCAFILLLGVYPAVINEPLKQTIVQFVEKMGG